MSDKWVESEFEDEANDEKIVCPYCKHEITDDLQEYYGEDEDCECAECEKHFNLSHEFTTTFTAQPDCELNKEEHTYEKETTYVCAGVKYEWYKCTKCGKNKREEVAKC